MFGSLLVLANHVNMVHGAALTEDRKRCLYCDAAFNTFNKLSTHSKEGHHHYFCDICFSGFISEPLLVEHHVNNHPKGCPGKPGECMPSTPKEKPSEDPGIIIRKVFNPELEKVMEVIRTPDPDPFANKWHLALSQVKRDGKNKVECKVCHRYLETLKLRVDHVKHFHPLVSYDCKFCPDLVFYTLQDLLKHCQKNHFICNHCDSAHTDKETLQVHTSREHQQPGASTPASTTYSDQLMSWSRHPRERSRGAKC